MATAIGAGTLALPHGAAAEPVPGVHRIRCQDPATRQWRVLADHIANPETTERPAAEGGGRIVRGTGPDGQAVTVIMPADRTCMMSAR
ncbi:hypothetical protein HL658_29230 [Azospirillum sp. RWY-5-1]|uniref:Uncharacterized protein n=1 Tax=Azospirillum oleiclasticum TaxID=2735135 RepID=A0ABX2TIG4_9PROT|nr:hypothetical protein [Azospirillum oleiclasticum]NYZ24135.1 hypothetical protein [Azospirillum oleiclasticum]